jgi:hypothetical protein
LWANPFRTSVLDVDDIVAGGQLHGVLRTAFDIHATSDFALRLQCIRSREDLIGNRHCTQDSVGVDDILGQWKQRVQASCDTSSLVVPFSFALDPEMPPTAGAPGTNGAVRRALIASAPRGTELPRGLPIPVRSRSGVRHHEIEGAPHARNEPSGSERSIP